MKKSITPEIAKLEIEKWLDFKKISNEKRIDKADQIEALEREICDGVLVMDDNFVFKQTLKFPFGDEVKITELSYKPRISVGVVHAHLANVKAQDVDGRILAYVAALTAQPKKLIQGMDSEDYGTAQNIAVFFL